MTSSTKQSANIPREQPQHKVVVVHSGARDGYQLAQALAEANMLDTLVTDLFWPADRAWARFLTNLLPARIANLLRQRSEPSLPFHQVRTCWLSGLAALLLGKVPGIPFAIRRRAMRYGDATLGRVAGALAARQGCGLVSYSYYGYDAFTCFPGGGILFQLHPHPLSMRRILSQELAAHPDCSASLEQEWELALPEADFQRLVRETAMPSHILAASTFTQATLMEQGISAASISVIPYGVNTALFTPGPEQSPHFEQPLRLLFVGRINQRKGIKYLLEALGQFSADQVHLTVCGRVVDDLSLFRPFGSQVEIRPSVSQSGLIRAYRSADLFVFPSVAEGFGQVLLESLACGLPILSTTHTAAPDLIESGRQGFIVEPRRPDQLVQHIQWCLDHRQQLFAMRRHARARAEQFTWQRFRSGVVAAVECARAAQGEEQAAYV